MSQSPNDPTPINFYAAARAYVLAASMIYLHPERTGPRVHGTFLPVHMLLGFAVELCLKAWLAHDGVAVRDLKFSFGHDLKKLWAEAQARGLSSFRFDELVEQLHEHHSDYGYRYMASATTYNDTNLPLALLILQTAESIIDQRIGASLSVAPAAGTT